MVQPLLERALLRLQRIHLPWRKGGLSVRLLWLTILFVMIAEVLIYVPLVANFRLHHLEECVEAAELAVLALDATEAGMVGHWPATASAGTGRSA